MKLSDIDIQTLNQQLRDEYGSDTVTGLSIFRVTWAVDEFENRLGTYEDFTPGGIYLRTVTEVRRVRKYPFDDGMYVLERLVVIPDDNRKELPDCNLSYEPLWTFMDKHNNPLPPKISACQFIIQTVLAAQAVNKMMINGSEGRDRPTLVKYQHPQAGMGTEELLETHSNKIKEIENQLFGDEVGQIGLDVLHGQGVHVPSNYIRSGDKQ